MLAIFESILPVFLIVGAGIVLRRLPFISEAAWPGMEQIAYWFLYPSLLFFTIYNADFSGLQVDALLVALLLSVFAMGALTLLSWPLLKNTGLVKHNEFSSVFQTSIRWNGFIALPVAQSIFPAEGPAMVALAMAVIIIPINIAAVTVVMQFANRQPSFGRTFMRIVLNPLIIASAAAVVLRFMPFQLYGPINETLRLVGSASLGLGLMAIGASLRLNDFTSLRFALWLPVILKLLVFPIVMISIALMLGIQGPQIQYLALCAAVPTAMNGYLLARQLGGDAELYAAVTTLQTGLAFFTMPLVLAVAAQLSSG